MAPAPASGSGPNRALLFGRSGAALLAFAHFSFLRSCHGTLADSFAEKSELQQAGVLLQQPGRPHIRTAELC